MTIRKRRQPTPAFNLPPPYHPISGEHARLMTDGVYPYSAMFQVAAEDTYENYVICRGVDTRTRRFIDYAVGDANKPGIPVAKPYGKRGTGQYNVGEVYPALLPLQTENAIPSDVPFRIGQNPGVAATSAGHPANLEEEVELLYTDEGKLVHWILVDSGGGGTSFIRFELIDDMTDGMCTRAFRQLYYDDDPNEECGYWETDTSTIFLVQDQGRSLCGWGGWTLSGETWERPAWAGDDTGTGTADLDTNENCGSFGVAWIPGDTYNQYGTGTDTGTGDPETIYEVVWMTEPCEMFVAAANGDVNYTDENIPITSCTPMHNARHKRFWQNTPPPTVPNIFHWYVYDTAPIICARYGCHSYYPVQVACPVIEA